MKLLNKHLTLLLIAFFAFAFISCISENNIDAISKAEESFQLESSETKEESSMIMEEESHGELQSESDAESEESIDDFLARLVFEDNFSGDTIDESKWQKCPEWDRYDSSKWKNDMSFVDGEGNLVLRAEWDEETKKVNAGAVRTFGRFQYGLGYYEATIKLPIANGIWGAFWMMVGNVSSVDGTSTDGVEIDIIESIGNDWGSWKHALHWDGYDENAHQAVSHEKTNEDIMSIYDGEYHNFALWRKADEYVFFIDGEETFRTSAAGVCTLDGYMKLTVEAATWAGAKTENSILSLPAEVLIDSVRVWTDKPTDEQQQERMNLEKSQKNTK